MLSDSLLASVNQPNNNSITMIEFDDLLQNICLKTKRNKKNIKDQPLMKNENFIDSRINTETFLEEVEKNFKKVNFQVSKIKKIQNFNKKKSGKILRKFKRSQSRKKLKRNKSEKYKNLHIKNLNINISIGNS